MAAGAAARSGGGVDDAVNPAMLERLEPRLIHLVAVRTEPNGVVVKKHDQYGVELDGFRREWVVEFPIGAHHVGQNGLRKARRPRHVRELL